MENADAVSSLHCQSILIECGWKKNPTQMNEIALLLWPQSDGYKWSCDEKCVSFRMNGKAKVKTTITTAQQCDAIVNRYYYYFGMEVGCIEVYACMYVCMDDPFSYLLHHIVLRCDH